MHVLESIGLALSLLGQAPPPLAQSTRVDAYLPSAVRPAVEEAAKAELDPKRGSGNAIEILRAERAKYAKDPAMALALDLRVAGTILRTRFMSDDGASVPLRIENAVSTFSRLDLAEPGLSKWLERAQKDHPLAKQVLGKKGARRVEATLLARGSDLDRKQIEAAFRQAFQAAGFDFVVVPANKASLVIKLSASGAPPLRANEVGVKLDVGLESVREGKILWQHTVWRIDSAPDFPGALAKTLEWVAHIAGRDLLFRWLGERVFPTLAQPPPGSEKGGDGHGHGITPVGGSPKDGSSETRVRR